MATRKNVKKITKNPFTSSIMQEILPLVRDTIKETLVSVVPGSAPIVNAVERGISRGAKRSKQQRKNRRQKQMQSRDMNFSQSDLPTGFYTSKNIIQCGDDLLEAVLNPMGFQRPLCLPISPLIPSFKTVLSTSVTFVVGTAGIGFASFAPCLSSGSSIVTTAATYTGTLFVDQPLVGISLVGNTALFPPASFTGIGEDLVLLNGRVVMFAMDVIPLQNITNRKGFLRMTMHPNGSSLAGHGADTNSWPTTLRFNVATVGNRQKAPIWYHLASEYNELGYRAPTENILNIQYPWSQEITANGGAMGNPSIGVFVDGATVGDSFTVRIRQYMEYIGPSVGSYCTISALNTSAYERAVTIAQSWMYDQSQSTQSLT